MSSILRTYGTAHCVICGSMLPLLEKRYCPSCQVTRPGMIRRLESDDDLLRVMVICTRKGAKVPPGLWCKGNLLAMAQAVNIRLQPLLYWLEGQVSSGKLLLPRMGVLWVDITNDVLSLYNGTGKMTDAWKTNAYNDKMRPFLANRHHQTLLYLSVAEFRRQRDLGFDHLFPKGQDVG